MIIMWKRKRMEQQKLVKLHMHSVDRERMVHSWENLISENVYWNSMMSKWYTYRLYKQ